MSKNKTKEVSVKPSQSLLKQIEHGQRPPIIVTIKDENTLSFKMKGSQQSYELDVELGWAMAVAERYRLGRRRRYS